MRGPRLHLVRREPDKAYISDKLWLPKALVAVDALKQSLQYYLPKGKTMILERLWDETEHHLIVPREFIPTTDYGRYPFQFINLNPRRFPVSRIHSKITLRNDGQQQAYDALTRNYSGLLNLAPGRGKTVLALKRIADLGCPALIIVHNTYLYEQWLLRIDQFLSLPLRESIGRIQGSVFDWEHPITIAMIHTLALRAKEDKIPPGFGKHFGVCFYDEVHHLAAPFFCATAPLVLGHRYGLTATEKRADGLEFIYNYGLGPVFWSDMAPEMIPEVFFQQTPVEIDLKDPKVHDVYGEVNISKLRSYLGRDPVGNEFRYRCIKEAYDAGRKILVVGHAKDQLISLSQLFKDSGLVVAETPQEDRPGIVANSRVTFAIARLGIEGLDDDKMDVLFFLTPFSSENDLTQAFGRIQRSSAGKKVPIVIVFEDHRVPPLRHLCAKLKKILVQWKYKFDTLPPPVFI
jgi:superfamily II DNA or RNA helicase